MRKRNNIRVPRLYKITSTSDYSGFKDRDKYLREIVDLGEKAKDVKEILDYYLDCQEDDILKELVEAQDYNALLNVQMKYKAILALDDKLKGVIHLAKVKLDVISKAKEDKVKE